MDGFDIAAYGAAIITIGGPIFATLMYVIKKGGPLIKKYFEKLILKLDEVVDETKENSKNMSGHLEDSERHRRTVEQRFESTLQEVKDVANLAYDNRDRINALELLEKEKNLEEEKQAFRKQKERYREEC